MELTELLNAITPRHVLALAIALSVCAYALAANLTRASLFRQVRAGSTGQFMTRLRTSIVSRVLGELARWLYYLGLPYATLVLGYNTARALGVWNVSWLETLGYAIALGVGAAIVFIWVWRPYARTEHPHAVDASRWNSARHVVELVYQQAHWAFYRSGPILWLGDVYWGSFIGFLLTLLEGWTHPTVRSSVRDVTRADAPLWTGSLAVVSTVVFIFTQNFWYSLMIHLLLDLGLRKLIGFPKPAPEIEESQAALDEYVPLEMEPETEWKTGGEASPD